MENVAEPLASSADEPMTVAASRNITVPVGVLVPDDGVTLAVNVTDWPSIEGFVDDPTAVVVLIEPGLTVCVSAAEVLVAWLLSPL